MSAFGNHEMDQIVHAIRKFAESDQAESMPASEVVEKIMEAVTYGVAEVLSTIEAIKAARDMEAPHA